MNFDEQIRIALLIKKSKDGSLSEDESAEFENWKSRYTNRSQTLEKLLDDNTIADELLLMENIPLDYHKKKILSQINPKSLFLSTYFIRWVAAAFLIFIIAATWFLVHEKSTVNSTAALPVHKNNIVVPAYNKATLTLTNGEVIALDNTLKKGIIYEFENIEIIHNDDGIVFKVKDNAIADSNAFNTLTTPKGGQYKVVLADGTEVWLNTASSIMFPTSFTGKERKVSVTGEAYFEVVKNVSQPFVVKANRISVKDLGTKFNIMSYRNENSVKTTLTEGLIAISTETNQANMQPGEQAVLNNGSSDFIIRKADIEEVLAWKTHKYFFKNTSIKTIMRQLERWYDIDVVYHDDVSSVLFSGGLTQKDNVSQLLEMLQSDSRLRFTLNGRIVTVYKAK